VKWRLLIAFAIGYAAVAEFLYRRGQHYYRDPYMKCECECD